MTCMSLAGASSRCHPLLSIGVRLQTLPRRSRNKPPAELVLPGTGDQLKELLAKRSVAIRPRKRVRSFLHQMRQRQDLIELS